MRYLIEVEKVLDGDPMSMSCVQSSDGMTGHAVRCREVWTPRDLWHGDDSEQTDWPIDR